MNNTPLSAIVDGAMQANPIFVLTQARMRLTDRRDGKYYPVKSRYPEMDDTDVAAYLLIQTVEHCIEHRETELCANCGQMRGMHSVTNLCRTQPDEAISFFQLADPCAYVYSANVPSGEGFQCDRPAQAGSVCCERHAGEVE